MRRDRKLLRLTIALIGCACLAYGLAYALAATTTANDLVGCRAIVDAIESRYPIPRSISDSNRKAIFCDSEADFPLPIKYNRVRVYGIADADERAAIVQTLQGLEQQFHTRRVLVEFYKAENWQTWFDPKTRNRGGYRGPETPVSSKWVN